MFSSLPNKIISAGFFFNYRHAQGVVVSLKAVIVKVGQV